MQSALRALASLAEIRAVSSIYETEAVLLIGAAPQPRYLNAAVRLETALAPETLLERLLLIERAHGRERREKWGPRTLDLDVLWIEGLAIATENLAVPHPRLSERAFALGPLLDVAPDAKDPTTGLIYAVPSWDGVTRTAMTLAEA
ncbi:2-amino-4-hydroxy-6-hydroxymethyldihydropteridinediphosphokinase [soil metagenome]